MIARGWGAEGEDWLQNDMRKIFGVIEMFYILIMEVIIQLYTFVKIIACKLYFNKPMKKWGVIYLLITYGW